MMVRRAPAPSKIVSLANVQLAGIRQVKGVVTGQPIGFEATLFAKSKSISCRAYVRFSYGPQYAAKLAAPATAKFKARSGKNRNLKIGQRFPPAQEQKQLEVKAAQLVHQKATQVAKEAARKAAKVSSKRALPNRLDRGKLKLQRWQC